jgi:hypothetical protein
MAVRDARLFLSLTLATLFPAVFWCRSNTTPGEFLVDPPTLASLGFAWKIAGDDNRNARVDFLQQRVFQYGRQLHRSRRRCPQHSRL